MAASTATTRYDFLRYAKPASAISIALMVLSIVLLFYPGAKYGIDFAGGTNAVLKFSEAVDAAQVREAVQQAGFTDAAVQAFGGDDATRYVIETQAVTTIAAGDLEKAATALRARFGDEAGYEYSESSGDRLFVRLPEAAYTLPAEEGETLAGRFGRQADDLAAQIQGVLAEAGLSDPVVEPYGNPIDRRFVARVAGIQTGLAAAFKASFGEKFVEVERVETVGPRAGEQLRNDGVKAVLLAIVFILIYIAFRFDIVYAPGAILCLIHDVVITMGIYVVLGEEISLTTIAAFLTIVGYSLNDTIVNFDRIRENLQNNSKGESLRDIVNRSVNECLSRTILTSATTLVAVVCLYTLGGGLIQSFALAMGIGIIIGAYSSIYISNPLMIVVSNMMEKRTPQLPTNDPVAPTV